MPARHALRSIVAAPPVKCNVTAGAAVQSSDGGGRQGKKSTSNQNSRGNQRSRKVLNAADELHAAAMCEIETFIPAGSLVRTFKGCRSDFGYHKGVDDLFLPIIVQGGSLTSEKRCKFRSVPKVVGRMPGLLLCRPYPQQAETLVIPETMTPSSSFHLTYKENTKWYPFFVADRQLAGVLEGVYDSVGAGQQVFTLPSGKDLDISELGFISHAELCMPTAAYGQKSREFFLLREQWLPAIAFQLPQNLYTPVDAVVDGVRIGNVAGAPDRSTGRYRASVFRGTNRGQGLGRVRPTQPYEKGDIDVLWAYNPDKVHLWLIPAHVLAEKGVLATPQQPGKSFLSLYDHEYVQPARKSSHADLWSQEYLYSSQDPELTGKVLQALRAAKP